MFDSKPKSNTSSSKRSTSNQISNIYIDPYKINPKLTFSQEIPEELKNKSFLEKLKRVGYDKIPKDAEDLDQKLYAEDLDQKLYYGKNIDLKSRPLTWEATTAAKKLKKDSNDCEYKTRMYLTKHNNAFNKFDCSELKAKYFKAKYEEKKNNIDKLLHEIYKQQNYIHVILLQSYLVAKKMQYKLIFHINIATEWFYLNGRPKLSIPP